MLSVSQLIALQRLQILKKFYKHNKDLQYTLLIMTKISIRLVAPRGFEPLRSEPKSDVLPLYNRALNDRPILL